MNTKKYLKSLINREKFLIEVEKNVFKRNNYSFPSQIIIETTTFCNMKCIHCGHKTMKRNKGNMDVRLYKKIIDEIALEAPETEVWLTLYGEALLLKYKLFYMIQYAKKNGLKYLILNTNGMLLDDEMADLILESGLDRFIFSIDGFTRDTFNKIRVNGDRDKVYANILNLLQKKKDKNLIKPYIEIQFSVMDENENELNDFIEYWSNQDVFVKIREKFTWCNTVEASNLDKNQGRIACPWAISVLGILWNGEANMCVQEYEGINIIGSLTNNTIREIWNSEKRKSFINKHLNHNFNELPTYCRNCMDWQAVGAETYYNHMTQKIDWKELVLGSKDDKPQLGSDLIMNEEIENE